MIVAEIDGSIPTVATLFCLVHDRFRGMFIAYLAAQRFMVYSDDEKISKARSNDAPRIQDSGDHLVLPLLAIGKSIAVHMEMQTAG